MSGTFHPGLELAFLGRIKEIKKDPLASVAVVAPSSRLVERLQWVLAADGGSYLNIHFHTFASLAEMVVDAHAPLSKSILSDPLFFDTLVKQIVKDDKPFEAFSDMAVPDGFPPAVRGTLRDLLDAGIHQENVDELIQEGFVGTDVDLGSLRSLLNLHRLYLRRIDKLDVLPRSELLKQAIKLAPTSAALAKYQEILYYGFYDLTGLQADFFQAVAKHFPSRFFFPYVHDHPAYSFAKNFRDVFVQPVMQDEIICPTDKSSNLLRILNISGIRDEAWFIANEIRRLHDEEGIEFLEMGVVARTKDRLGFVIQEAFQDRGIPFKTTHHPSLLMFPETQEALKTLQAHHLPEEFLSWEKAIQLAGERLASFSNPLKESVASLAPFEQIVKHVTWDNFIETLRDRWSRMERRDPSSAEAGVSLLYAEAARGLPFKALFLIGLEEKVFPRIVREDPFLRDDAREALNGIGYKISKKMTALEEEKLLFELLVSAASERLYLLYQRSNDEGGVVGASPFLRAFAEERGVNLDEEVVSLPRPLMAKIKSANPATLGFSDVMVGLLAAHQQAEALQLAQGVGRDEGNLERGLRLQKSIHSFNELGVYDGLIGKRSAAEVFHQGKISATALETYGQCGFKYFASRLLGLAPLEKEGDEEQLAADIRGQLVHRFVEAFFRQVTKEGQSPPPTQFPREKFNTLFDTMVTLTPPDGTQVPLVLWQATREGLKSVLSVFLENEINFLRSQKITPVFFEVEVEGRLPAPLDGIVWTGKIDRIDETPEGAEILDYKSGRPFKTKTVSTLAKNGEKLQAPLYLLLAGQFLEKMGRKAKSLSFRYEFVDYLGESRVMSSDEWAIHSQSIQTTIRDMVDSARQGNFVMKPGWYCDYCEVVRVCRKNHGISVYRSEQGVAK
ncbi:MAG: ATP-dependent helicase/deoxyribonuclease subunit B [Elusimicrobia bacterium]|nr:ATP-dependent helicase/deoxyribonuclease subunit B [Elusimicrobiota bacterium]